MDQLFLNGITGGNTATVTTMGATGMKTIGGLMMLRTKLIVVGIVACIMFLSSMIVTSYMAAKIRQTEKRGGISDTTDLDSAYKWGWASSIVYGGLAALSGGLAIALIVSLFLLP